MNGWCHVAIDLPADALDAGAGFWAAALGWRRGERWRSHPEFVSLEPPDGDGFVIVQTIADGRPRVHLDFEVDERAATTQRLIDLGATRQRSTASWTTLLSPGGMPFCLVPPAAHGPRPAPIGTAGGRSRLVQVCIDSPAGRHDREVEFWRAATGWRWAELDSPEFAGKLRPETGMPVQLLLQRLGPDDPGLTTRAHLDLGADDREAEAARLQALGASWLWSGDGWIALRDPVGLAFCVTGNSPDHP